MGTLQAQQFGRLLFALADAFSREGRPVARQAVNALRIAGKEAHFVAKLYRFDPTEI